MNSLENLTIKNFRGFDSLEIKGLSKINLFVGKNNSGKSSILESIFLLMGMSNPMLPSSINQFRGLNIGDPKQLKYLFHNLKTGDKPYFFGDFSDGVTRSLEITAKYISNETIVDNTTLTAPGIAGLDLNFTLKKRYTSAISNKSSIDFAKGSINQKIPKSYSENQYAAFVSPEKDGMGTLKRYAEIIKRKSGERILKSLQIFDNRINEVRLLPDGIYFDLKDIEELVPINIMGDGTSKFLNVATAVAEKQDSFICIDEIENGLHYSAHKILWENLMTYSKESNVQLFITTHNLETISCLKELLETENYKSMQDSTKVFSVSKTLNAGYKTYRYSFEGFKDAIEHETEIRN